MKRYSFRYEGKTGIAESKGFARERDKLVLN